MAHSPAVLLADREGKTHGGWRFKNSFSAYGYMHNSGKMQMLPCALQAKSKQRWP